ncbi:MAG: ATPase, T2SS/T4P/T4SS family [Ruthenibacterium sp.]
MVNSAKGYYEAAAQLPCALSYALLRVKESIAVSITEIRLRSNRPVVLTTPTASFFVDTDGNVVLTAVSMSSLLTTSHAQMQTCFHAVCAYSVHSFQNCIAEGFVPLSGGHRVGLCGMATDADKSTVQTENITSLNIRIARVFLYCDNAELKALLYESNGGILLIGAPASGKTTLLRSVLSMLSKDGKRVAAVDERFEIAPLEQNGFVTVPPLHCDILSGFAKPAGMMQALRGLSPDVIVCDEVGTMEDAKAIEAVANGGVRMIATIHAADFAALRKRPQMQALLQTGAFCHLVLLTGSAKPCEIKEVISVADFMEGNRLCVADSVRHCNRI